jgi:UDP-glucose 4-epimerase
MNILITGGAGYIGSHVAKAFLEQKQHKITILDNLCKGSIKAINALKSVGEFEFVKQNLEDLDALEKLFDERKFEAVIHFAAFIEVFESMQNPIKYYQNNTANAINLIAMCQKYGVKNFVFSSTAATYGEPDTPQVTETSAQNPINPYGKSKLMSEWVLRDTAAANPNFRYAILRYFNVAGASSDGLIGQNYPNATHLIKVATQTILGKRDKMAIFGDDYETRDGTCIRDYIHVEDLANAHLSALEYIRANDSEIFNVGYGTGFSVKEVIDVAKSVSGVDFKVEIAPRRDGDPACLIANSDKLRTKTSWKPMHDDLKVIISSALNWEKNI